MRVFYLRIFYCYTQSKIAYRYGTQKESSLSLLVSLRTLIRIHGLRREGISLHIFGGFYKELHNLMRTMSEDPPSNNSVGVVPSSAISAKTRDDSIVVRWSWTWLVLINCSWDNDWGCGGGMSSVNPRNVLSRRLQSLWTRTRIQRLWKVVISRARRQLVICDWISTITVFWRYECHGWRSIEARWVSYLFSCRRKSPICKTDVGTFQWHPMPGS